MYGYVKKERFFWNINVMYIMFYVLILYCEMYMEMIWIDIFVINIGKKKL